MADYVRRHTAGSIIRSSFQVYGRYFGVLFASSLIPFSPVILVELVRWKAEPSVLESVVGLLLGFLNTIPITVLISDICTGNEPRLGRAYRRAFGKLTGTVLLTYVMVVAIVMVGIILLVLPGILFAAWFGFAVVVAVLERASAPNSLARSRQLGKGYYLRNMGIYILVAVISLTPAYLVAFGLGFLGAMVGLPPTILKVLGGFVGAIAAPPLAIAIVLLYYDMRVRKEAYDSTKLAEDLKH